VSELLWRQGFYMEDVWPELSGDEEAVVFLIVGDAVEDAGAFVVLGVV